ncbi:Ig domain-containing protein [Deinococcus sp. LM3]|uniref:Ig domain-containing protein n=2 Tax=unclassified Deinococcus TaxID=2623546 RepID=UPI0009930ECA|nr:Ig domain-containing protein [Deinococcus sp. LM3]OOV13911.1 cell ssuface protein containing Ig-like domain protein [Deinococcus sp. LM3]
MAPHAPAVRLALAGLLTALLAACGQEITGTTSSTQDALYFADSPSGLPPLYTGEVYAATLTPAGGAGPYTARLAGGTLPPGLTLSGLNLSGTPNRTGTYTFTVEVTDSTLSTRSKEYRLTVQDLPALSLAPTLPVGEIRGDTRIPVTISAPRTVRAARLVWDLPAGVSVSGAQPGQTGGVLFWRQDGQRLTVDVGFKTVPRSGARVALLSLKVTKPVTLAGSALGFEARDGQGKLLSEKLMPDEQKKRDEAAAKAAAEKAAADRAAADRAAAEKAGPAAPAAPVTPAVPPASTPPAPSTPVSPAPAGPPDPAAPTPPGSTPREGTPPGGTP